MGNQISKHPLRTAAIAAAPVALAAGGYALYRHNKKKQENARLAQQAPQQAGQQPVPSDNPQMGKISSSAFCDELLELVNAPRHFNSAKV